MATPQFDKSKTAILIMDFQNDIVKRALDPAAVLKGAVNAITKARQKGLAVIHIQHRGGQLAVESPGAHFHNDVAPVAGETVLIKTKTGPFSTTGLDVLLREKGIGTLALMGVATSGCVLTTLRGAYDLGYKAVVLSDGCADFDEEVNRVLLQKVFPKQAQVMSGDEFINSVA